ncbi:MAG TPA: lysophospholipid acyltransferase family protein [Flavisolibacter sp.]
MYYVVYGLLYLLSLLPLRVLYLFSDFAYVMIYYVAGYRKGVVMGNLETAFPQKTMEERKHIAKKFYRNFTDTFIEMIKMFSAGPRWLNRHVQADFSLLNRAYEEGRKSQVHLGHNFNWEVGNAYSAMHIKQPFLGVYMPLGNQVLDRVFRKLRSKYGTILIPATEMRAAMLPYRTQPYTLGLVADQSPANQMAGFWVNFFGKPTSFVRGPEKGALAGNLPVIFCHITKTRRGYYHIHFEEGAWETTGLGKGELTIRYVRYLERVISENPDMWLWSHRRWKLQWKPEYGPVIG